MSVLIETTVGDFVVDLFVEQRPRCCLNFLKLCKIKYYNFSQFHSIEANYIAQTGDPTGKGTGGDSIFAKLYGDQARYFEMESIPKMRHRRRGLVSMVNNGAGMLGSQFFITLADELDFLDDKHTIFGQVTEGLETIEALNQTICDDQHRPFKDTRICHTIVLDDPFDDPPGLKEHVPSRSPSPTADILRAGQINVDEELNDDEGKTEAEIREEAELREAAARAQILEMVGDLHYADEKAPDNVLFVCKLNPITTDEDLEIIFARFGSIKCCEIIRDRRTGKSLQYAFIEFDKPESCESAFFKMDNVLIDDRRIHVDFSQSVSKNYQWDKKSDDKSREKKTKFPVEDARRKEDRGGHHTRRRHSPSVDDGWEERKRTRHDDRARATDHREKRRDEQRDRRRRSPSPPRQYRRRETREEHRDHRRPR